MMPPSRWLAAAVVLGASVYHTPTGADARDDAQVRVAIAQSLPALNGSSLKVTVLEVSYQPGDSSRAHSHPCPVIGYVLSGKLRTQVDGGPVRILGPGETFYEPPGSVHRVSGNASADAPVRFLATFTCDREVPLTTAVPESKRPGS